MQEKHFVIAFDVSDDRRRRLLTRLLLNYAYRVQYSVFEMCVKSENIKELLEERIRKIVDPKEDSVIIYEFAIDDWAKKVKIGIPTEQEKQNGAGFLMI